MNNNAPTVYGVSELQKYNPRVLVTILFRRRWIVAGVFLPIFAFGMWGTLTSSDSYSARTQVLIEARSIETPEFRHLPVDNDVLISTAVQVAQSIPVAEIAVAAMADSFFALRDKHPEQLGGVRSTDDLRDVVLMELSASQIGESNVVEIYYSHENPEFALLVVGHITDAFLQYSVESKQNKAAVGYYTEQIAEVEAEMQEMMDRRLKVYESGGLNAYKENTSSGIQHMRVVEYDYHKARSRRIGMEKKYEGINDSIAEDPFFVPSITSAGENANLIGARQQYDDAVMELARVRMTYNEDSEFVVRQKEYVKQAEEIFVGIRDAYIRDLRTDLNIARSQESEIARSLEEYRDGLMAYPELEKRLYAIDLEIESKKDLLEALQLKRGEIRLKAFSDQRISNITPLNKSSVDIGIQGSKKIIYLMLTGFLGLVLSFVVGVMFDALDHRIYDVQQAEAELGLPVLGAVSALESGRQRT